MKWALVGTLHNIGRDRDSNFRRFTLRCEFQVIRLLLTKKNNEIWLNVYVHIKLVYSINVYLLNWLLVL